MKWKIEYTLLSLIVAFVAITLLFSKKGSQIKSFLGRADLPRGIRNNNPGNLVRTNIPWQGKVPHVNSTDNHFEQFEEFRWGVRAMIKDLQNDIGKGLTTISALIYEYAPPFENNTEGYISTLSNLSGIGPNEIITGNKATMKKLVPAISRIENGVDMLSTSDVEDAWAIL